MTGPAPIADRQRSGSVLRALLAERNMLDYPVFRREYTRHAGNLAPGAEPQIPSRDVFADWMSGGPGVLSGDDQRGRVLEAMFPGRQVSELMAPAAVLAIQATDGRESTPSGPTLRDLGAMLRRIRRDAEVNQTVMAAECVIDRTLLSKIETGTRTAPRQFWAEADAILAAEGELLSAYDRYQAIQHPARSVRVLARGAHRDRVSVRADMPPEQLRTTRPGEPARHLRAVPDIPPPHPPPPSLAQVSTRSHLPPRPQFGGSSDINQSPAWEVSR